VQTLREWPDEAVDWPLDNSRRIDLRFADALDEGNRQGSFLDTVTLMPYFENKCLRINADPYDTLPEGSGRSETDPGAFLLAYWMMRWTQL
jgi:hypothetical protein